MAIVWLGGGLGNQMFQYAFGLSLQNLGFEVSFDASAFALKANSGGGGKIK